MQIRLIGVGHQFPGQPELFAGITAEVAGGSLVAVTGPSGSGKSTLLALLAGWLEPASGRIEWDGATTTTWVPQNPYGVARRTAVDHVALPLICRGARRSRAETVALRAMARFGLEHRAGAMFGHLSGGEAQRLLLARASLVDAQVLLVDEPTAQLDPSSAHDVISTLTGLVDPSRAVFIATHDPRVVGVCQRRVDLGSGSPG